MIALGVLFGLLGGYIIGVSHAASCQVKSDERSIEEGYIKLCGSYYKIEKL